MAPERLFSFRSPSKLRKESPAAWKSGIATVQTSSGSLARKAGGEKGVIPK